MAKRVILEPNLIEQNLKRDKYDLWIRWGIAIKNQGSFYTQLYSDLFGGEVAPMFKGEHDVLPNGELRNIHPDVSKKYKNGIKITEVKSTSLKNNRPLLSREQIENSWYTFSQHLIEKNEQPRSELAIFRYGTPQKYIHLHYYSTQDFIRILSKSTKDLVILPSNLALFSSMISRKTKKDRSETKSEAKCTNYHRCPSGFLTEICRNEDPIKYLFSLTLDDDSKTPEYMRHLSPELRADLILNKLMLHKLKVKRTSSDEIAEIKCRRYKFQPFTITSFSMDSADNKKWLEQYKQHHKLFLEDLVGVRDLYEENKKDELPF